MSRTPAMLACYAARKSARLCVDCAAGLQDTDRIRCVECLAVNYAASSAYRTSEIGRAGNRRRLKARRAARTAAGLCIDCGIATSGPIRCERHRDATKLSTVAWKDRKEQADANP